VKINQLEKEQAIKVDPAMSDLPPTYTSFQNDPLHLLQIPSEILKEGIIRFSETRDALNFQATCKNMKKLIDLALLQNALPFMIKNESFRDMDDGWHLWEILTPIFPDKISSVIFTCVFKDQGWGNRKSAISISEIDATTREIIIIVVQTPIAEHHLTDAHLTYMPNPSKLYALCYKVGGGGGHQLIATDPKVSTIMHNSIYCKLHNSKLPLEDSFFNTMLKEVLDMIFESGSDVIQKYPQFVSLFNSIGLDVTNSESICHAKLFLQEYNAIMNTENQNVLKMRAHERLERNNSSLKRLKVKRFCRNIE